MAIVLIGLVLIISSTSWYRRFVGGPEREGPVKQEVVRKEEEPPEPALESQEAERGTDEDVLTALVTSSEDVEAKQIYIRGDLFQGTIETRGALVSAWEIKPRDREPESQQWVQLLPTWAQEGALSLAVPVDGQIIDLNDLVYRADRDTLWLSAGNRQETLSLTAATQQGLVVTKEFTFYNDKYIFELRITMEGAEQLGEARTYTLWWKPGLSDTEDKRDDDLRSFAAHTMMGDVIEKSKFKGKAIPDSSFTGDTKWFAIQTKYFLMAMIPPREVDGLGVMIDSRFQEKDKDKEIEEERIIGGAIHMPLQGGRCDHRWRIYIGPMDYFRLKDLGIGLEKTVYLGRSVLRWIGMAILHFFVNAYKIIPNYGVVIIIFSILVKALFYPLTRKSIASIRKMQEIQPEIKKLQAKYKKDPAKLQKATMELYRKYNVNPASGCFPMLLQMPVFFALYAVFRNTIELRGASFLWIKDLSAPDTVYQLSKPLWIYGDKVNILPIIMAVTMFIQQKISMRDPKQAYMVYVMPLFLFFIFNNISSGLVLYWTMFNLLHILQESLHPHKPTVIVSEEDGAE
jgi:YidC/Oxa1 family membrane protein insertase